MSKILIIGASPYLLTHNGRIHQSIISSLTSAGYYVESLVWHHDVSYFLPTELQEHFFEINRKRICRLHPFLGEKGQLPLFIYETMKKIQPSVVITIGASHESLDLWSIKSLYPHLFKWIAILTEGGSVINENYKEHFGYEDLVLCTTKNALDAVNALCAVKCEYLPYGPDTAKFHDLNIRSDIFGVMASGKNSQTSNLTATMKALSDSKIDGYIHTNIDDPGDNDLRLLLRRWGSNKIIGLPEYNFVSIREGISDSFMNELYNRYHVFVDISMQSSTALSLLEAMSTGCIPVGVGFGAIGEVISKLPPQFQKIVPHNLIIGPREEEYAVACPTGLKEAILSLDALFRCDKKMFAIAQEKSKEVANIFSKEEFTIRLNEIVELAIPYEHAIVVDSF